MPLSRRSARVVLLVPVLLLAAAATGCGGYYKVTDPNSGKVYYTEDIDREKHDSAVRFKDAKTDAEVTLQSSDIQKIDKKDYKAAVQSK